MLTEAIHTPFLGDRALALENARYIMTTARSFGDEIECKPGGKIERRAQDVLAGAVRMVEPELPQSSGAAGWQKAPATPVTSTAAAGPEPWRTIMAPSDSMQASEDCGSAPVEKFASREVPSARPASRA